MILDLVPRVATRTGWATMVVRHHDRCGRVRGCGKPYRQRQAKATRRAGPSRASTPE
jgi:hypothetical protein